MFKCVTFGAPVLIKHFFTSLLASVVMNICFRMIVLSDALHLAQPSSVAVYFCYHSSPESLSNTILFCFDFTFV